MNMNRKIKLGLVGSGIVATGALAQSGSTVDLSAAGTAATSIASGISTLLTGDVMTAILTVVGAALAIWAVFLIVRYVRRGAR